MKSGILRAQNSTIVGYESEIEQCRIPFDGSFECEYPDGVLKIYPDYQQNAAFLREFLLGSEQL